MSFKFRFLSTIGLAMAIAGFAGASSAQDATTPQKDSTVQKSDKLERRGGIRRGGEGFRGGMHKGPAGFIREFRDLNLTEAQKQQIHTILESNKPDQAAMDQMKALREARKAGGEFTAEQKNQLKSIRQAQADKMKSLHEQIMNVLTVEQKQQLEQRHKEREQLREQRREQFRKNRTTVDKPTAAPKTS